MDNHYELTDGIITKYYYAGSQRIAMRKNGTLNYIIGDNLGSTSLVTDASGNIINQTLYKAWGEERYSSGTKQTGYGYTGQYSYASDFGLHFYNARWYDSSLGRFAQADTIVPGGVQGYDRYAYTNNNPIKYTDPSGHIGCDEDANGKCISFSYKDKGPFPKPNPSPVVIIVCGAPPINCGDASNNNAGGLDAFDNLGKEDPIRLGFDSWYKGVKYDVLNDILAALPADRPIILVGHSAGADAIILALSKMTNEQKQQLRGVILIDPTVTAGCHDGCLNGEIDYSNSGALAPILLGNASPLFIYDSDQDGINMSKDENGGFSSSASNYHYNFEPGIAHMDLATSGSAGLPSEKVFNLALSQLNLFNYQWYK